jgi:hypothetical protein
MLFRQLSFFEIIICLVVIMDEAKDLMLPYFFSRAGLFRLRCCSTP